MAQVLTVALGPVAGSTEVTDDERCRQPRTSRADEAGVDAEVELVDDRPAPALVAGAMPW